MVGMRIVGPILVAAAAVGTLLVGRFLIEQAGGEEPLPVEEQNTPGVQPGILGSVVNKIENIQKVASDFFIFDVRFSNLAQEAQTFEALMQIKDPRNNIQVIKTTKITVEGRSSRLVRFGSGNLFDFAVIRGIWNVEFFAWESLEVPVSLSQSVFQEFVVDVL